MSSQTSQSSNEVFDIPVVIIGGSLVGLSTSMFLGLQGIPCLSLEKHQGTAIHPRAGYFQLRTLEMMRQAGIEDKVVAAAHALYDPNGGLNAVESLAGREIANYMPDINQGIEDLTPVRRLFMPQQVLEPIIKDRAEELGSQFLYSHEVISFSQDETGVSVTARDLNTKEEKNFRARYLVACDGCRSPVRQKLGIEMIGHSGLSKSITIYFRADCSKALRGRNLGVIYINNPKVRGFFRLEKTGMGGFLVIFTIGDINEPGARNAASDVTEETAIELVRDSIGDPELAVSIEDIHKWEAECHVAERYQQDRIFLAGDSAHVTTPTGGFGGNTGVQDAHNLAWKLAHVIEGKAGETLLESYNQERQPAGRQAIEQAYNRYVLRSDPDLGTEGMEDSIPDTHVEFNRYTSTAVIPDTSVVNDNKPDIDPRESFALPGTRAPHVDILRQGKSISTLDLFDQKFVLLVAYEGAQWSGALSEISQQCGLDIGICLIDQPQGNSDLVDLPVHRGKISSPFSHPIPEAYGITSTGAVLVRPDGYVAFKDSAFSDVSIENLVQAVKQILSQ